MFRTWAEGKGTEGRSNGQHGGRRERHAVRLATIRRRRRVDTVYFSDTTIITAMTRSHLIGTYDYEEAPIVVNLPLQDINMNSVYHRLTR